MHDVDEKDTVPLICLSCEENAREQAQTNLIEYVKKVCEYSCHILKNVNDELDKNEETLVILRRSIDWYAFATNG